MSEHHSTLQIFHICLSIHQLMDIGIVYGFRDYYMNRIVGLLGNSILTCWGTAKLFSTMAAPF